MEVVDIMEVAAMAIQEVQEDQEDREDQEGQEDQEDQEDQAALKEQACQAQEQSVANSTLAMMFLTHRLVDKQTSGLADTGSVSRLVWSRSKNQTSNERTGNREINFFQNIFFFNIGHPHGHPMGPIS